ncbi:hypothetical protein ABW21_db0201904 [Orbilia brochopaga]|nr:hypothetical protein ABW21_db0201904 [Drechslerella brochopaga]
MEPGGIVDSKTGEQMSSVLYERPLDVPEHQIISLLPLKALGYNNALKAVDAVKKAIREEGLGVREAITKTVISFGVTDQAVLDKITTTEDFKPLPPPSTSKPQPAKVREGYVPPHQRSKLQEEKESKGIYVPPHLRSKQQTSPWREKQEETEKKEEEQN